MGYVFSGYVFLYKFTYLLFPMIMIYSNNYALQSYLVTVFKSFFKNQLFFYFQTTDSFITYTAHYLAPDLSGELKSKVLECARFDRRHTSNNLKEDFDRIGKFLCNIVSDLDPKQKHVLKCCFLNYFFRERIWHWG